MTKEEKQKYSEAINSVSYDLMLKDWKNTKNEILNYLNNKIIIDKYLTGKEAKKNISYTKLYNHIENCSEYGLNRYLMTSPKWLFLEIFDYLKDVEL